MKAATAPGVNALDCTGLASLGDPGGVLLSGAPGPEDLSQHEDRLGSLTLHPTVAMLGELARSGLTGRGGGQYPLGAKIGAARKSPGAAVVVINGSESEPASGKDRLLLTTRPHLVLDGAQVVAAAAGAERVIVAVHDHQDVHVALRTALRQRQNDQVEVGVHTVAAGYLAGESGALVSALSGGPATPTARAVPTAVAGVDGRPTVVSNVETVAHAALIARFGAAWFAGLGPPSMAGTVLVTVSGDVGAPGRVLEVVGQATIGDALRAAGTMPSEVQAVLLGGYGGSWLPGAAAARTAVDPVALRAAGTPFGCGLVAAIDHSRCGLAESSRLASWLSDARAGQCGGCTRGLPHMAQALEALADGRAAGRRQPQRILSLGEALSGTGLCHLPDSAVAMVASALAVFADEAGHHRRGRCRGGLAPSSLPLVGR